MLDRIFQKNKDFIWSEVGGEGVLLNMQSGDYFGLNEVGLSFWEKVDNRSTLGEILEKMLEEYEVEMSVLKRDLVDLASEMLAKGLLLSGM